jgi:AraC-like DNA-binding protein
MKLLVDTFQYIYYVKEDGRYLDRLYRTDLTPKQMERIHRITWYIYMNCGEKITLDQLARTEFYSRFHISHFIKRAFGLSYQETLSLSRAVVSERILLATDFNLDQVAALAGFSTRSQYCNHFKRWHGISPARYRKENAAGAQGNLDITFPVSHQAAQALLSPLPESHPSLVSSFHSWEDAVPGKE